MFCFLILKDVTRFHWQKNSRSQIILKIGVPKNFAIFTGKYLFWRLQHWCFPVNIAKYLRTALFIEHLWWLLLKKIKYNFTIKHNDSEPPSIKLKHSKEDKTTGSKSRN